MSKGLDSAIGRLERAVGDVKAAAAGHVAPSADPDAVDLSGLWSGKVMEQDTYQVTLQLHHAGTHLAGSLIVWYDDDEEPYFACQRVEGTVDEATLAAMSAEPPDLHAWFGPAISQPAFEVGAEVRAAFLAHSPGAATAFAANDRGRWQADLYALAAQRLAAAGVESVCGGGLCTFADAQRFYSYRRDGETGRMLSFIFRAD